MSENDPARSYFIAIGYPTLSWAVTEIVQKLTAEEVGKLKISSGEHLAAILTTAFLFTAPTSIDSAGGPDLVFDLAQSKKDEYPRLGLRGAAFADFEVKSLPGKSRGNFREHEAAINRALDADREADQKTFTAMFTSVNTVLREEGRSMIAKAKEQLDKKSQPGHSKNIFLIAHFFDYPIVESRESPLIAHLLEPLSDIEGIDSVWVLWAPSDLAVWSAEHQEWTNLIFGDANPGEATPIHDERMELLQHIEFEFLERANNTRSSPYAFGLTTGSEDRGDN